MIQTIYVTPKLHDTKADALLHEIKLHNKSGISRIQTAKIYRIEGVSEKDAQTLSNILFSEKLTQAYTQNASPFPKTVSVEIGYKPGVMNPEVASIMKSARDLKIAPKAIDTSYLYAFLGTVSYQDIKELFTKINIFNPLIEEVRDTPPNTLLMKGSVLETTTIPIRSMNVDSLMALSKNTLFLNEIEMKTIQKHFKNLQRDPTDCELEVLAQTWSEHCVHKTFKAHLIIDGKKKKPLFTRIKQTEKYNKKLVVSAFHDNSGIIDFYDGYAVCGKVETHNSPSAIEPYGGAMTGSGGVFRDILGTGLGAKPIVSTDVFCLAHPTLSKRDLPPGCLPPLYILKQVIKGVRDYGNRVGVPTNNGSLHFHNGFKAKPTVAVGAYGIIPKKYALKKDPKKGSFIITLGGATGRDGIHGATFSSGEMTDATKEVSGSAVQIGNAIEEKRLIDCILSLRDNNLIESITDCGAGGFSSAIGEMGENTGAKVYLERVPLKYEGLRPWEIFLSESQERMVLSVQPDNLKRVKEICQMFNVPESVIGEFTGSKKLQVFYEDQTICDLSMEFLHNGLPKRILIGKSKKNKIISSLPPEQKNLTVILKKILSHPTVASKESIVRLYDHNVQGSNALHPYGGVHFDSPNDGSIVKPLLNKPYGFVTTHGLNPSLTDSNIYQGSLWAITEAVSNFVAIGGDLKNAALIDNFIWPFPDSESLADLDKAVDACSDMAQLLTMPFVSGKDSLSSTYRYPDGNVLKIPPVLLISVFGKIPDVSKTVSSDFKKQGSTIVLLGNLDINRMGGSLYLDFIKHTPADIPHVDTKHMMKIFDTIYKEIQKGSILSCHDISEGGLGVTLSEMCFGADFGCDIDVKKISSKRDDFILFNETAGTFLVEVESDSIAKNIFKSIPHKIIGKTTSQKVLSIQNGGKQIIKSSLSQLKQSWQKPMKDIFS